MRRGNPKDLTPTLITNPILVYVIYLGCMEPDKVFHCVNSNSIKTSNIDRGGNLSGVSFPPQKI